MVEVDDHPRPGLAQPLLLESAQEAVAVESVQLRQLEDGPGLIVVRAPEVLLEKEPFDSLGARRGDLHPLVVEKDDLGDGRIRWALPEIDPAQFPESLHLVGHYRQRHHLAVADIDAGGEQAADEGTFEHARGPAGVASPQYDGIPRKGRTEGGAELGGELRRQLHVAQPAHHGPVENAFAPFLAPDDVGGHGGAVFDLLARPHQDARIDLCLVADLGFVGDDRAVGDFRLGADPRVVAQNGVADTGAGFDVDVVPEDGAVEFDA